MTVRSRPLGSVNIAIAGTTSVFTCPAGRTAIVRYVTVSQLAGALNQQFTYRGTVLGVTQPFWQVTPGVGVPADRLVYLVLGPGDSLEVITTQAASSRAAAYGALLLGAYA